MYGALGAAQGLGQGLVQVGAAQMQEARDRENEAKRQAEWDRQQREKNEYFEKRAALRDQYGDENWQQRHQGGAIGAARGGTGTRSGGGAGGAAGDPMNPVGQVLRTREMADAERAASAQNMGRVTGSRYDDNLAYLESTDGVRKDVPVLDARDGMKNQAEGTVNDLKMGQGAENFRRMLMFQTGKGATDAAQGDMIVTQGRRAGTKSDEEIEADIALKESRAGAADAQARRADRTPVGGKGGAGTSKRDPTALTENKTLDSLDRDVKGARDLLKEAIGDKARATAQTQLDAAMTAKSDFLGGTRGRSPNSGADGAAASAPTSSKPITKAEYDKLASGEIYIAPDLSRRVKP
jgi:hypothetical protein